MEKWNQPFETRVPGKFVLTGEHSVLKGVPAVALPHPDYHLQLEFIPGGKAFAIEAPRAVETKETLEALLVQVLGLQGERILKTVKGRLRIESSIPMGAGFGSSAAFCVALTEWIGLEDPVMSATRLENFFHGQSSGMDVTVCYHREPVRFLRGGDSGPIIEPLGIQVLPRFTFHDTKERAQTKEMVEKVETFRRTEATRGQKFDDQMGLASEAVLMGLGRLSEGQREATQQVADGMKRGQNCFLNWGLLSENALKKEHELYRQGALAVKMTGAGGGGFLVALWDF